MLNATWLETFTALCEIGHFTRTADRLGMTQPGVSQHLRKLEAQIGKPLITQEGKTFILTPAGEATRAVGKARQAQEQTLRDGIEIDDPNIGKVSIGCSGSFAMCLYPELLPLMRVAPDLSVHLEAAPQNTVLSGVLDGSLDLGVVAQKPDHPRLCVSHLVREELCLVLPTAMDDGAIDLSTLDALGFVAHPDGFAYADELFSLNFPGDFTGADRLRVRTFVNQIGQIPSPVAQGLGYTILPRSGVDAYPRKQDLKVVSLPLRRHHDLWLILHHGRSQFARVTAIAQVIGEVAGRLEQA